MKKQKIIGWLLFGCLLMPVVSGFCWLQFYKILVRKEVKRQIISGIDKKDLVHFTFTKSFAKQQLDWKHRREFVYKGQKYDVVSQTTGLDSIEYWCWHDTKETEIDHQIQSMALSNLKSDPRKAKKFNQIQHFFNSLFHQSVVQTNCLLKGELVLYLNLNHCLTSQYIKLDSPPPEFLS
ncbi:MAG: hypothetical protein H6607_13490 [Flavobacteriales bacterium]|nr:hypothetical protein [Flavobacteriales bacterium]